MRKPAAAQMLEPICQSDHSVLNGTGHTLPHRSVADVGDPAVERGVLPLGDDDARPRVVDEDGRAAPVDLPVVLRDDVVRPPDAACKDR